MAQDVTLLSRLTSMLASTPPEAPLSERLLEAFVRIMEADGGAITIGFARTERTVVASVGVLGERIEELQDVLREGPALDAFRSRERVATSVESASVTWPLLGQSLEPRMPWLVAYPMIPHTEVLGVLSTYQFDQPRTSLQPDDAAFLANTIGMTIVGRFERSDTTELLWSARDQIDHAVGMVVAQLTIVPADALALLRAHAFAHNQSLSEVADAVTRRTLDFRQHHDGGS
ncbi:MAG: hypothetical protein JWR90_981 [Marmoricola sp.]|jgi:hypothetical protein|nr:hypothetical protein [Marmoricola sp.]